MKASLGYRFPAESNLSKIHVTPTDQGFAVTLWCRPEMSAARFDLLRGITGQEVLSGGENKIQRWWMASGDKFMAFVASRDPVTAAGAVLDFVSAKKIAPAEEAGYAMACLDRSYAKLNNVVPLRTATAAFPSAKS